MQLCPTALRSHPRSLPSHSSVQTSHYSQVKPVKKHTVQRRCSHCPRCIISHLSTRALGAAPAMRSSPCDQRYGAEHRSTNSPFLPTEAADEAPLKEGQVCRPFADRGSRQSLIQRTRVRLPSRRDDKISAPPYIEWNAHSSRGWTFARVAGAVGLVRRCGLDSHRW